MLHTANGVIEKNAYPIVRVEDTGGACDTVHAAFLASLCRSGTIGISFRDVDPVTLGDAVDFGWAAAAIDVSRVACAPPTQAEVDMFVESAAR